MSGRNVVGVDVGYSNLKVVAGSDPRHTPVRGHGAWITPSGAGPAEYENERMLGESDAVRVLVDGREYVAGIRHDQLSVKARVMAADYSRQDTYRALVHAALLMTNLDEIDLLVTGLPVKQWADAAERERLAQQLVGTHQVSRSRTVKVNSANVIAQPMGGFMDLYWSKFGGDWLNKAMVLVVDPGFYSLDWVLMREGEYAPAGSGTNQRSVKHLLDRVDAVLKSEFGGAYGLSRLEKAVRDGTTAIWVNGKQVPLEPYLSKVCRELVPEALQDLKASLTHDGEAMTVDRVVIVGGGARFFEPHLREQFGADKVVICDNPELANARGYWVFGHLLASE